MHKVKILFISHSLYLFGAENCVLSLIKGLEKDRFEATVVVPAEGPLKQKLDELGVRTYILPLEWWVKNEGRLLHSQNEIPLALDKLLRIIDEEQPDIMHSNTSVVCWGAIAAAIAGVRHIWHVHEILNGHPSLEPIFPLPLLYEAINFLSDKVVVVSNSVREEMCGFVEPDKLRVIYNGVDFDSAAPPSSLRSELNAAPDQLIAVTVTSLQKYKGLDNLLAAAAKVVERDDTILFAIVGSGPPEAVTSLRTGIREMNLEGRVYYLGYRTDVSQILAGSDIFVLPSTKEAFPLVVLEAMSHGKPVVATDCGGTKEMVVEGETGFVVPVEDSESLAAKIVEISCDKGRGEAMGNAARKRYADSFTTRHYVTNFTTLYEEIIAVSKPRLTSRQTSLLNSIVTAYVEYLKTMRMIPGFEQDLSYHKRQLLETNSLLTQKQEALLASERNRISETEQHAEKVLSLVTHIETSSQEQVRQRMEEISVRDGQISQLKEVLIRAEAVRAGQENQLKQKQVELAERDERIRLIEEELTHTSELRTEMQTRLDKKKSGLANLDERLGQLEEEIVCALELRSEVEKYPDHRPTEIVSWDERIRLIREKIARTLELRTELESRLLQQGVELGKRDERIRQLDEALIHAEEVRSELKTELKQKSVELADRDERIRQIEEHLGQESRRVEEQMRLLNEATQRQVDASETVRIELGNRLQQKSVELADRDERIRQIQEEILQENQRVAEQMRLSDEATQRQLGTAETIRIELENRLKQVSVQMADRDRRTGQIGEEIARQTLLVDEKLRLKDEIIVSMGEQFQAAAHKLKALEAELAHLQTVRDEEKRGHEVLLCEREQRIEDLLNSLSWKVTGPLRKSYELVRGKK